jgi:glycosyltransferase involved in cell wall biosynthesis
VGRLVPNKCPHDAIKSFHIFRQFIHRSSRLILVGSYGGFETYHRALTNMIHALDLGSSVVITGRVSQQELMAYYQSAHTFLCLSAHEGFCVPIVEAFRSKVAVVALNSGALPDTLGDAGVLLGTSAPHVVAEALESIRTDQTLRQLLIDRGIRRYEDRFSPENIASLFRNIVEELTA